MDQTQPSSRRRKSIQPPDWLGIDRDLWLTGFVCIGSIGFGLLTVFLYKVPKPAAAFMWAFACLAVGSLLGLLFAVPRVVSNNGHAIQSEVSESRYRLAANTSIEQISDWLTKLLVGVGLVELKELPAGLTKAAKYVGDGLGGNDDRLHQFAAALLGFFLVEGFLGGYLATRMFFQRVIERADESLDYQKNSPAPSHYS